MTIMNKATVTLDVRDHFREGRDPFSRIMETAARLQERGFTGETEEQHDGSFVTTIRRA